MDKSGVMDRDRAKIGQTSPRFSQKKSISNRFGLTTGTSRAVGWTVVEDEVPRAMTAEERHEFS